MHKCVYDSSLHAFTSACMHIFIYAGRRCYNKINETYHTKETRKDKAGGKELECRGKLVCVHNMHACACVYARHV